MGHPNGRRQLFKTAVSVALATAAVGCATSVPAASQSSPATLVPAIAGNTPMLDPANPDQALRELSATSNDAQRVVAASKAALGLNDAEAACLATRLDADSDLRDALRADPLSSPRYQDASDLATDCIRATTGAVDFANGIAAQAPGLPTETLACLRDGYAKLNASDVAAIVQNGLTPDSVNRDARDKLTALLAKCKVDPGRLPQPPNN